MNTGQTATAETMNEKGLKGWHVLLIFLGFFGVMFSVNGVFLYHAITSFPGEDVKKSYVQGLNYNQTLAARADQAALGWRAEAGLQGEQIILRLWDVDGRPLTQQSVIGELRRSATDARDHAVIFEHQGGGEYAANAQELVSGRWHLKVSVFNADATQVLFNVEKAITLP